MFVNGKWSHNKASATPTGNNGAPILTEGSSNTAVYF